MIPVDDAVVSCRDFTFTNVKNFYLNTPLDYYEYMWMPIKLIPLEFIDMYGLTS